MEGQLVASQTYIHPKYRAWELIRELEEWAHPPTAELAKAYLLYRICEALELIAERLDQ